MSTYLTKSGLNKLNVVNWHAIKSSLTVLRHVWCWVEFHPHHCLRGDRGQCPKNTCCMKRQSHERLWPPLLKLKFGNGWLTSNCCSSSCKKNSIPVFNSNSNSNSRVFNSNSIFNSTNFNSNSNSNSGIELTPTLTITPLIMLLGFFFHHWLSTWQGSLSWLGEKWR